MRFGGDGLSLVRRSGGFRFGPSGGPPAVSAPVDFIDGLARYPADFKVYRDGDRTFSTSYDLTSPLSAADPTVTVVYVDPITGSNAAAGTAIAPVQGLAEAANRVKALSRAMIVAKGGLYAGSLSWGGIALACADFAAVSWDGGKVISSQHDTGLSWSSEGSGTYSADAGVVSGLNNVEFVWDARTENLTSDGDYLRILPVADLAACQAAEGTYALVGSTLYLHLTGGRAPDADVRVYRPASTKINGDIFLTTSAASSSSFYFEDFAFHGGQYPFRIRADDGKLCTFRHRRCEFSYSPYGAYGNGLNTLGDILAIGQESIAVWNISDGFNYHKRSLGLPSAIEIDCEARWNGINPGVTTNNGTSIHDGGWIVRVNGYYHHNQNRNVHDVNDSTVSWNLGCRSSSSQSISGAADAANWATGIGAKGMWLDQCDSDGSAFDIETDASARRAYVYEFQGDATNTGTGQVLPYTP